MILNIKVLRKLTSIQVHCDYFFRKHTAVKIAPKYKQPTIHVVDASKSVVVVG